MNFVMIPYVTTLAKAHAEISENAAHFVAFVIRAADGRLISHATIPFCRFRAGDNDVIEARSCDCEGVICGHPVQRLYISGSEMKNWIYAGTEGPRHIFVYSIEQVTK